MLPGRRGFAGGHGARDGRRRRLGRGFLLLLGALGPLLRVCLCLGFLLRLRLGESGHGGGGQIQGGQDGTGGGEADHALVL